MVGSRFYERAKRERGVGRDGLPFLQPRRESVTEERCGRVWWLDKGNGVGEG